MQVREEELDRRRLAWKALAVLFVDDQINEPMYFWIASRILESGYSPSHVRHILWNEVFPALEFNLRSVTGGNKGFFPAEWLESTILTTPKNHLAKDGPEIARTISESWRNVQVFLPVEFSLVGDWRSVD